MRVCGRLFDQVLEFVIQRVDNFVAYNEFGGLFSDGVAGSFPCYEGCSWSR